MDLNFIYCGDKKYVESYLPTLINSVESFNGFCNKCHHYVICSSEFDVESVKRRSGSNNITPFIRKNITEGYFKESTSSELYSYNSDESLLRFEIFNIEEIKNKKVLYLDIDCICRGNLEDLFNEDHDWCAVPDPWSKRWIPDLGGWVTRDNSWDRFNAGVMLLNLPRLEGYYNKIMNYFYKNKDNLKSADQQVLGEVRKDYYPIDPKYNFCVSYLDHCINRNRKDAFIEYMKYFDDAVILHYTNKDKPWNSECRFKEYWSEFNV